MKLKLEEGISNWIFIIIILACASPAVTLNVWPRIEQIMQNGASSNAIGIVLLVTLSALGMTCVPFAMKKAENLGFWLTCLIFGIGLGILNYTMAVGAIGKVRDNESDSKKAIIERAEALRASISENEKLKISLPVFKWTTNEMVETAKRAVDLAIAARDQECIKVGDICRARVTQLGSRQSELATIEAERGATKRAEEVDNKLLHIRAELFNLGPLPQNTDQQASRIAAVVGYFIPLGINAAERVATGLIHFIAICAEAFALGMPRIIITALGKTTQLHRPIRPINETQIIPPSKRVEQVSRPSTPSVPPQSKTKPNPAALAPSILEWKEKFLIKVPGKVRAWIIYQAYCDFEKASGRKPVDFLNFDKALGIQKITEGDRDFYVDIAIKQPLKVVS